MKKEKAIFIIGDSRSGTTLVTKVLDLSPSIRSYVEQAPKLGAASRLKYMELLSYPDEFIYKSKIQAIKKCRKDGVFYADKNQNYIHFIENIDRVFNAKFVFVFRDGRDVVTSKINCDTGGKGVYGFYEDSADNLNTQAEDDLWDFGRIRPKPGSAAYHRWRKMSKFAKICWAWAEYNKILIDKAYMLDKKKYFMLNITNVTAEVFRKLYRFLKLGGFNEKAVSTLINSKVNTADEICPKNRRFPRWQEWNYRLIKTFDSYCVSIMRKLGYY